MYIYIYIYIQTTSYTHIDKLYSSFKMLHMCVALYDLNTVIRGRKQCN